MRPLALFVIGFLGGTLAGCEKELSNDEACDEVIMACHTKDDGSDPIINGCHETAHLGGDCLADLQMCVEACDAAPNITTSYGSYSSGSGSSSSDGDTSTGSGTG